MGEQEDAGLMLGRGNAGLCGQSRTRTIFHRFESPVKNMETTTFSLKTHARAELDHIPQASF